MIIINIRLSSFQKDESENGLHGSKCLRVYVKSIFHNEVSYVDCIVPLLEDIPFCFHNIKYIYICIVPVT